MHNKAPQQGLIDNHENPLNVSAPVSEVTLKVSVKDRGFKAALDQLSNSPNALQGLADLDFDFSDLASKLLRIEADQPIAGGARNMTVGFYPSDFLLAHLQAHGAGDF